MEQDERSIRLSIILDHRRSSRANDELGVLVDASRDRGTCCFISRLGVEKDLVFEQEQSTGLQFQLSEFWVATQISCNEEYIYISKTITSALFFTFPNFRNYEVKLKVEHAQGQLLTVMMNLNKPKNAQIGTL